jgi:hypothetical protein
MLDRYLVVVGYTHKKEAAYGRFKKKVYADNEKNAIAKAKKLLHDTMTDCLFSSVHLCRLIGNQDISQKKQGNALIEVERHILAIIKGIIEQDDDSFHFGSTLGLASLKNKAKKFGLIDDDGNVTEKGMQVYHDNDIKSYPSGRANYWRTPKVMIKI